MFTDVHLGWPGGSSEASMPETGASEGHVQLRSNSGDPKHGLACRYEHPGTTQTRVCGFDKTATGHGRMNLVSNGGGHCSAGHPCESIWTPSMAKKTAHVVAEELLLGETDRETHAQTVNALRSRNALLTALEVEGFATSSKSQVAIWVEWHHPPTAPFDAPEFFALGPIASIYCGNGIIEN